MFSLVLLINRAELSCHYEGLDRLPNRNTVNQDETHRSQPTGHQNTLAAQTASYLDVARINDLMQTIYLVAIWF